MLGSKNSFFVPKIEFWSPTFFFNSKIEYWGPKSNFWVKQLNFGMPQPNLKFQNEVKNSKFNNLTVLCSIPPAVATQAFGPKCQIVANTSQKFPFQFVEFSMLLLPGLLCCTAIFAAKGLHTKMANQIRDDPHVLRTVGSNQEEGDTANGMCAPIGSEEYEQTYAGVEYSKIGRWPPPVVCDAQISPKWKKQSWDGKAIGMKRAPGEFGNQLFYAAMAYVTAQDMNRPVKLVKKSMTEQAHRYLGPLPCFRSSPGIENITMVPGTLETVQWGGFQQDPNLWGIDPERHLPLLREIFSVRPLLATIKAPPGPNDLVLYYRTFNSGQASCMDEYKGIHRITAPPFAFFRHAVKMHKAKYSFSRIWVLAAPEMRECPTARRLVKELNATLFIQNEAPESSGWLYDFTWMTGAQHLAISPSTFAWWAAVLSRAKTIYFPIMPGPMPFATGWCPLIPLKQKQYVFHDWFTNTSYHADTPLGAFHARKVCSEYEQTSHGDSAGTRLEKIKAFYPELPG